MAQQLDWNLEDKCVSCWFVITVNNTFEIRCHFGQLSKAFAPHSAKVSIESQNNGLSYFQMQYRKAVIALVVEMYFRTAPKRIFV
jgi:hypothetical protein